MVEAETVENLEFKWGKKRGIGGKKKDVQFYESFTYDGVEYTLYDSVYLYKEGEPEPYIGKLIKIWENPDKTKKVKILWFFRCCEILNFLGTEEPSDGELFLASGDGVGLANVNPLEAIAGKCNVVCISKDSRNRKPSNEEIQKSDFVFYRTFDVGQRKILDELGEKVAGIEVKLLLNRVDIQKTNDVLRHDKNKEDLSGNAIAGAETAVPSKLHLSTAHVTLGMDLVDNVPKENGDSKDSLIKQKSLPKEKPGSGIGAEIDKMAKKLQNALTDKISPRSRLVSNKTQEIDVKAHVGEVEVEERVKLSKESSELNHRQSKMVNLDGSATNTQGKDVKALVGEVNVEEKGKLSKESGELDNRPSKKAKLDGSANLFEDNSKPKIAKDSCGTDEHHSKKLGSDEKLTKRSNGKMPKASPEISLDEDSKIDGREMEVTRRPDADRSKWFRGLPWEERMKTAHEQGTLVLLQNLDPAYTSAEIEDILWHAFKESCTAKMIQRTAFSSPHSGQAYVIFKTREAAENAIRKLDEGCLLLPNGRPLVGSIGVPCFPAKRPAYFGHFVIDKLRRQMQQQRDMKDAVSTSHCSQPNTIEYDMAMEWCLLQERADRTWEKLHKQQGQELKKLKANLKSRRVPLVL